VVIIHGELSHEILHLQNILEVINNVQDFYVRDEENNSKHLVTV
jgi:hypothetical protein